MQIIVVLRTKGRYSPNILVCSSQSFVVTHNLYTIKIRLVSRSSWLCHRSSRFRRYVVFGRLFEGLEIVHNRSAIDVGWSWLSRTLRLGPSRCLIIYMLRTKCTVNPVGNKQERARWGPNVKFSCELSSGRYKVHFSVINVDLDFGLGIVNNWYLSKS